MGSSAGFQPPHRLEGAGWATLAPLYARAQAARLLPHAGFRDPLAENLLGRTGGELAPEALTDPVHATCVLYRALTFDLVVQDFVRRHPHATILTVGVGLCTRNHRLARRISATVSWVGVDTEDTLALRARLLPKEPMTLVAASLTDPGWARHVPQAIGPVLVLAEGVLAHLDGEEPRGFLRSTRQAFGGGTELLADYVHPLLAGRGRHPLARGADAPLRSGFRDGARLASLADGWRCLTEYRVLERVGLRQRLSAATFRARTLGARPYAVAQLLASPPPRTPPAR